MKTIMTAEDSTSVRKAIQMILEQDGYNVIEAEDGQDALEKIKKNQVDMLLTDMNMPKMDGFALIKAVRAINEYRFIPIIALTTESQIEKKMLGKKVGATGWIVKPFKPDKLLNVVKKVLK